MARLVRSFCVLVLTLSALAAPGAARVSTDYEARQVLRELGFRSFITKAEVILVASGRIEGKGGITVDLPILGFVSENNIYVLDGCASGARYDTGALVFKAQLLHIAAAYGTVEGRTVLIIGRDLRHIANKILD